MSSLSDVSMTLESNRRFRDVEYFLELRKGAFRLQVFVASLMLCCTLLPLAQATAASQKWNKIENIKAAASHLAKLHRAQGSQGVVKFLDACYRTHMLASDFNRGLEACMAQDYMHSQVLAVIYAKLPAEDRQKAGAPSPEFIAKSMGTRFAAVFDQYKFSAEQTADFKKIVDKHGFPIFVKAVFPKANSKTGGEGQDGQGEKK